MSDITPLLLDAKREYTSRLREILEPQMTGTFMEMYMQCVEEEDNYICFQNKLREIPYWNSMIVQQKTQQLITTYSFFENLMTACIVTFVKVLSAIKLGDGRPSIKLRLPKTDEFVHELYKQMAKLLYYSPELLESRESMESAVGDAIEASIRRIIPYDDILESYLTVPDTQPVENEKESSSDSSSDEEEEDDEDEEEEDLQVSVPPQYGGVPSYGQQVTDQQSMPAYREVSNGPPDVGSPDIPTRTEDPYIPPTTYPAPPIADDDDHEHKPFEHHETHPHGGAVSPPVQPSAPMTQPQPQHEQSLFAPTSGTGGLRTSL
jgi:hypothetical protein